MNVVQGDKGYDSNAVRAQIESAGAAPNTPPKPNRRYKPGFSPALYRDRNAVERMFGRLKDFRRIGTRYDRKANVFLSAVCLAATEVVMRIHASGPFWGVLGRAIRSRCPEWGSRCTLGRHRGDRCGVLPFRFPAGL